MTTPELIIVACACIILLCYLYYVTAVKPCEDEMREEQRLAEAEMQDHKDLFNPDEERNYKL